MASINLVNLIFQLLLFYLSIRVNSRALDGWNISYPHNMSWEKVLKMPAFVLNMDMHTNRMNTTLRRLQAEGYSNTRRVSAVDVTTAEFSQYIQEFPKAAFLRTGASGCLFSWIKVLRIIIKEKIPLTTIFEDDILFHKDFKLLAPRFYNSTPTDFEVCFIGSQFQKNLDAYSWSEDIPEVSKAPTQCTHAIMFTLAGAVKFHDFIVHPVKGQNTIDNLHYNMVHMFKKTSQQYYNYYAWNAFNYPDPARRMPGRAILKNDGLVFQDSNGGSSIEISVLKGHIVKIHNDTRGEDLYYFPTHNERALNAMPPSHPCLDFVKKAETRNRGLVISLPQSQAGYLGIETTAVSTYCLDGSLIRPFESKGTYIVCDGKHYRFSSGGQFMKLGNSFDDVVVIHEGEFNSLGNGGIFPDSGIKSWLTYRHLTDVASSLSPLDLIILDMQIINPIDNVHVTHIHPCRANQHLPQLRARCDAKTLTTGSVIKFFKNNVATTLKNLLTPWPCPTDVSRGTVIDTKSDKAINTIFTT